LAASKKRKNSGSPKKSKVGPGHKVKPLTTRVLNRDSQEIEEEEIEGKEEFERENP
jgi:hypothetical protein